MIFLTRLFFLVWFLPTLAWATPNVVVTLKPIHSLTARVMQNVGTPALLLPDGASPHTYQMKPSTLKQLKEADLIIWVGPSLENFMEKNMKARASSHTLLTLSTLSTLHPLSQRQGREWHHHHDHDGEHDHSHDDDAMDPHLWLSTDNAIAIVDAIRDSLIKLDPVHAAIYQTNAEKTKTDLQLLHTQLKNQLLSVHKVPFLVYHDGYQYFEKEFNLNAKGTVLTNPHLPLSAYGLKKIKEQIQSEKIECVFRETEFKDKMLQERLKDLSVKIVELDPLGVHFPPGPQHYFQTMQAIGNDLHGCLMKEKIEPHSNK